MSSLKIFTHYYGFSEAMGLTTLSEGMMLKLKTFGLRLRGQQIWKAELL